MSQFPGLPLLCQLFISSLTRRLYFFRACRHRTFSTSKVTAKTSANKGKNNGKPSERDGGNSSELRSQKSNYFIGKIKERLQSNDIKGSWSLINSLLGRNKKMTNVTELIVDDVSIIDDRSIAESMNEYFISIGTKLADGDRF